MNNLKALVFRVCINIHNQVYKTTTKALKCCAVLGD